MVKLQPLDPSVFGAGKWATQSFTILRKDADSFFRIAKELSIWEEKYLMLNLDLDSL
jgi:hypothetical protein|tara:strand:- start:515 stop:685 length:171 start_codon:yes stop_codon:yes gene_type:complete